MGAEKWVWHVNKALNDSQKLKMMALFLDKLVIWMMQNHIYMFNGQFYRQSTGAPIGLKISVNIARIVMIFWDRAMMSKLISKNLRVELFLRYVDDCNLALSVKKIFLSW